MRSWDTLAEKKEFTEDDIERLKQFTEALQIELNVLYEKGYVFNGEKFQKFVEPSGDVVDRKDFKEIMDQVEGGDPVLKEIGALLDDKYQLVDEGVFFEKTSEVNTSKEFLGYFFKGNFEDILKSKGRDWVEKTYQELKEMGAIPDSMDQRFIEDRIKNLSLRIRSG